MLCTPNSNAQLLTAMSTNKSHTQRPSLTFNDYNNRFSRLTVVFVLVKFPGFLSVSSTSTQTGFFEPFFWIFRSHTHASNQIGRRKSLITTMRDMIGSAEACIPD